MLLKKTAEIVEIIDPWLQLQNGNRVFTTLEGENPGGSMKDHMVHGEIEDLWQKNLLKNGSGISEVSAGSTAASLAYYCPLYGLKCVLFVPPAAPLHLLNSLQKQGAEIHVEEMSSIYGAYDSFTSQHPELHRFDQLFDNSKRRYYHSLGAEVLNSLGRIDAIIGSVGTGHSLLGTAEGMGRPFTISAEPESPLRIPGVRNVEADRYGEKDTCQAKDFYLRMIVTATDLPPAINVLTTVGLVQIPVSFQLVLAGLKNYLNNKKNLQVFAVGASLKPLEKLSLKQAA